MSDQTLFFDTPVISAKRTSGQVEHSSGLSQFFTPAWAAIELYDAFFNHLTERDLLCEPACGDGAMLNAVPSHVPAFGVEIDPCLARIAEARTGRHVVVGDFREVELPKGVTAMFGNPPFDSKLIEDFLDRASNILPEGGRCGFILPAYVIQTSSTVCRWSARWSLQQEALPRDIFPAGRIAGHQVGDTKNLLSKPLVFVLFTKDREPHLVGFRLYKETRAIRDLPEGTQRMLVHGGNGPRSVWRAALQSVLEQCGGRAHLETIYGLMAGRRPTTNEFWREKVRQTLQRHFEKVGDSLYALPTAA